MKNTMQISVKNGDYRSVIYALIALIITIIMSSMANAQKPQSYAQAEAMRLPQPKNSLSMSMGHSYINTRQGNHFNSGGYVSTIGLSYLRRVSQRWHLGVMSEVNFGEFRSYTANDTYTFTAVGAYNLAPNLRALFGAGMEIEPRHTESLLRVGLNAPFNVGKSWQIAPGFVYDMKNGPDAFGLMVGLTKRF